MLTTMTRLLRCSSFLFRKGGIRTATSYFYGVLVVLCWTAATKSSTLTIPTTHGFCLPAFSSPPSSRSTKSRVLVTTEDATDTTATSSASTTSYSVQVMTGGEQDPRVVDVATFRNRLLNPQMIVDRAQQKRDAIDPTQAALDGLKIGFVYLGPLIAAGTYFTTMESVGTAEALTKAVTNYGLFGGSLGTLLAVNNYLGRSVHVPDVPEATNRIVVDFSEGLLRQQDVGFIALSKEVEEHRRDAVAAAETPQMARERTVFRPSNGVLGAVDGQLRNSDQSPKGVRTVPQYPPHLHIKNMEVHTTQRRQGIGKALVQLIIEYAHTQTDAQVLTLEVEAVNQPAVQLYRSFGFETKENPNRRSKNIFMVKNLD